VRKLFKSKKKKTVLEKIKSKIIKIRKTVKKVTGKLQLASNKVNSTGINSHRLEEFVSSTDSLKTKLNNLNDHTIPNLTKTIEVIYENISKIYNEDDINALISFGKVAQERLIQFEKLKLQVEDLKKGEIKNSKKTKKALKKFFTKFNKLKNLLNELNQLLDNYKIERFPSTIPADIEPEDVELEPIIPPDLVTPTQKEEIETKIIAEPMIKDDHGMGSKVEELLRPTKRKKLKGSHKKSASQKDMITFILTMKDTNTLTLLIGALWVVEHVLDSESKNIPLQETCKVILRSYFKKEYENEKIIPMKKANITLDKQEAVGALNTYISEHMSITLFKHKKWDACDAIREHAKEYEIAANQNEYAKQLKAGAFENGR